MTKKNQTKMSSTRKAEPGSALRQERFCSSSEFQRGLMANLVARRCCAIDSQDERDLVYFLQLVSHSEGGLKKFSKDLVSAFPDRIGTKSMSLFGAKANQTYNAEQVRKIRDEGSFDRDKFILQGDCLNSHMDAFLDDYEPEIAGSKFPSSYAAREFLEDCNNATATLPELLQEICLDPSIELTSFEPWFFPSLIATLRDFRTLRSERRRAESVVTAIGKQIFETLNYTLEGRCMTLVDGQARTGKTFAVKAWCEQHPGQARYVQVPSTNDDVGFFRAIAKDIGVSINLNSKAQELRQRIEEALQPGHLALVLDEAHYLWPTSNYRDALPGRINWIMTALVNFGVPVCLVTTPQFIKNQKRIENKTCWTSEQFIGRIGHYEKLPESLSGEDLARVASSLLPEGDKQSVECLVRYAEGSAKYLAGIDCAVKRARYLAARDGRKEASRSDVKRAIRDSVMPSDSAINEALSEPLKGRVKGVSRSVPPALTQRAIAPHVPDVSVNRSAENIGLETAIHD
jgi:hypothetical protein